MKIKSLFVELGIKASIEKDTTKKIKEIIESIKLLNILVFTLILIPLGGFFTQYFVIINQSKVVTKVTLYTVLFNFSIFDLYVFSSSVFFLILFSTTFILDCKYSLVSE